MAALTLTPHTADDRTVYSDGAQSNKIAINVQENGTPLANTPLSGTLLDSSRRIAGFVFPGSTDGNGDIFFAVPATIAGPLTLTLIADAQTNGSMAITAIVFQPITFQMDPPYAESGTTVTITAAIEDSTNAPVTGVPVTWHVLDPRLKIHDTSDLTDGRFPQTFEYVLRSLTGAERTALSATGVNMQLTIGPAPQEFVIPLSVPVVAPLLAPVFIDSQRTPPVIDDAVIAACTEGIAFYIPAIFNTSPGDLVTLAATPTANPRDARLLALKKIDRDSAGTGLILLASATNPAFQANGPQYFYYTVVRSQLAQTSTTSAMLLVQVDRQNVPEPPDGNPVSILAPPQASPIVYTAGHYADCDSMMVIVDFSGEFSPQVGDQVTVKIYLQGYTEANMNAVKELVLPAYALTDTNFKDAIPLPIPFAFTAEHFAGVDGSDGQVYYLVKQGVKVYRSPSRAIVVDTVAAYSGGFVRMQEERR